MVIAGGWVQEGGGGGCGGYVVMNGDSSWGCEHTIQCTDDVLWNYVPETHIILLTIVTPINFKKGESHHKSMTQSWSRYFQYV